MREIVVIERDTVTRNGRAVLRERKYHGLLREDGAFRLLAYCEKRLPLSKGCAFENMNLYSRADNAEWARNFFVRQGALTQEYFVYFKEKQRSMAEKGPSRRRWMSCEDRF